VPCISTDLQMDENNEACYLVDCVAREGVEGTRGLRCVLTLLWLYLGKGRVVDKFVFTPLREGPSL
jgi:hypothetical protein